MAESNFVTVKDVNKQLDKGLKQIFESKRFQELLDVMSKVNNYSLNNSIMIAMQKPESTMVQGFNAWKEMGRFVKKGEKGIKILAPIIKKIDMEKIDLKTQKPQLDKEGNPVIEKQNVITGFKIVHVYDVSQTKGKEIPSVRDFINREMSNHEHISRLYKDFFDHVKQSYPIHEDVTEKGVGGYYSPKTNDIVISNTENKNDSMKFRVLIHEYSHAKLHNLESELKDLPRGHKEAQAESVAYIVSKYYGLNTDDISLGYIATWSQDIGVARKAIEEVQKVANEIILTIDELQRDKIQEFYSSNNKDYELADRLFKDKHGINLNEISKDGSQPTQLELLSKETGFVVSAKFEYSIKQENFHLRTGKNWIIPLSELNEKGDYIILNKELENGKLVNDLKRIPDLLNVVDSKNGRFFIESTEGIRMNKEFSSKEEADKYLSRLSLSQSLHEQTFLKEELKNGTNQLMAQELMKTNNLQVSYDVSNYLSSKDENRRIFPNEKDANTIGWAIMMNKQITSLKGLEEYAFERLKNTPSMNNLREAIMNSYEKGSEYNKESEKNKEPLEIER